MGRSSRDEAASNRRRIVEKAADLFRAHGVEQVSLTDVMTALGLTKGGFYKHFTSKEALVNEAVKLAFEQSFHAWEAVAEENAPGDEKVALVDHYLRPDPQRRCPMIAFAAYGAGKAGEEMRDAYDEGSAALLDRFAGKAQEGSPMPNHDMMLFAAMIGTRMLMEAAGDAEWASRVRDAVLDAARNGNQA